MRYMLWLWLLLLPFFTLICDMKQSKREFPWDLSWGVAGEHLFGHMAGASDDRWLKTWPWPWLEVSINGGYPQFAGWFFVWKIPIQMDDDWGYPPFQETSIWWRDWWWLISVPWASSSTKLQSAGGCSRIMNRPHESLGSPFFERIIKPWIFGFSFFESVAFFITRQQLWSKLTHAAGLPKVHGRDSSGQQRLFTFALGPVPAGDDRYDAISPELLVERMDSENWGFWCN